MSAISCMFKAYRDRSKRRVTKGVPHGRIIARKSMTALAQMYRDHPLWGAYPMPKTDAKLALSLGYKDKPDQVLHATKGWRVA